MQIREKLRCWKGQSGQGRGCHDAKGRTFVGIEKADQINFILVLIFPSVANISTYSEDDAHTTNAAVAVVTAATRPTPHRSTTVVSLLHLQADHRALVTSNHSLAPGIKASANPPASLLVDRGGRKASSMV